MDPTINLLKDIIGHLTVISGRLDRLEGKLSAMDLSTGAEFNAIDERFRDQKTWIEQLIKLRAGDADAIEFLTIKNLEVGDDPVLAEAVNDYLSNAGGEELRPFHLSVIRERLDQLNSQPDEGDEWKDGGD